MAKIVFMGDSITDSFHKFHVDEAGLGNGYVALIAERLRERGRADFIRNSGHDGFTVSGLLRLFEYDCLQFHPDLVTVQIGSNDAAVEMNTGSEPSVLAISGTRMCGVCLFSRSGAWEQTLTVCMGSSFRVG